MNTAFTAFDMVAIDLSSRPGLELLSAVEERVGANIARAAKYPQKLFLLRSSRAPGLRFVGGQARPDVVAPLLEGEPAFSLAGASENLEEAFAACVGECVERLSQIEREGDVQVTALRAEVGDVVMTSLSTVLDDVERQQGGSTARPIDWVHARCLSTNKPVLLPADWCLRRPRQRMALRPRTALSTGVAAGATIEGASVRALLEVVERDAASLWWNGGRRGRPLAFEHPGMGEAVRLLETLRQNTHGRASWLLDLTTDLEIPVVAAISFDTDGRQFACGLAARLDITDAIRAAILEMCQMELALLIAMAKQEQAGQYTMSDVDQQHIHRADTIDASICALVHPLGAPSNLRRDVPRSDLEQVKAVFQRRRIEAALLDLTRSEMAIPVVCAVVPELEPVPSFTRPTTRLRSTTEEWGGGLPWTQGVPLL